MNSIVNIIYYISDHCIKLDWTLVYLRTFSIICKTYYSLSGKWHWISQKKCWQIIKRFDGKKKNKINGLLYFSKWQHNLRAIVYGGEVFNHIFRSRVQNFSNRLGAVLNPNDIYYAFEGKTNFEWKWAKIHCSPYTCTTAAAPICVPRRVRTAPETEKLPPAHTRVYLVAACPPTYLLPEETLVPIFFFTAPTPRRTLRTGEESPQT